MRVFKTRVFDRFARKAGLVDPALREAIDAAEKGLVNANLGGGVIKLRVARQGGGKSDRFRTIILFRRSERAVFVYGCGKNERDNVSVDELAEFRRLATVMLAYSDDEILMAIETGALIKMSDDQAVP